MFALTKLFAAVTTLAEALAELATTLTHATAELWQRLALGQPEEQLPAPPQDLEQLPAPAGTGNGKRGWKAE